MSIWQAQPCVSVGVFADISGFSIILLECDYSNPVRYRLIYEFTNTDGISYELIKNKLQELKELYMFEYRIQINNLPSLQSALKGMFTTEPRDLNNLIDEYIKVQSYLNDGRLLFASHLVEVFEELSQFTGVDVTHRINALFLALTINRGVGGVVHTMSSEAEEFEKLSNRNVFGNTTLSELGDLFMPWGRSYP